MSSSIDKAWDSLPAQVDVGGLTYSVTPEAAALRSLFGHSAWRQVGNAGIKSISDDALAAVEAVQSHIADNYLFAIDALNDGSANALQVKYLTFVRLRDELFEADVCLACGAHTPGRTCHCENDE